MEIANLEKDQDIFNTIVRRLSIDYGLTRLQPLVSLVKSKDTDYMFMKGSITPWKHTEYVYEKLEAMIETSYRDWALNGAQYVTIFDNVTGEAVIKTDKEYYSASELIYLANNPFKTLVTYLNAVDIREVIKKGVEKSLCDSDGEVLIVGKDLSKLSTSLTPIDAVKFGIAREIMLFLDSEFYTSCEIMDYLKEDIIECGDGCFEEVSEVYINWLREELSDFKMNLISLKEVGGRLFINVGSDARAIAWTLGV